MNFKELIFGKKGSKKIRRRKNIDLDVDEPKVEEKVIFNKQKKVDNLSLDDDDINENIDLDDDELVEIAKKIKPVEKKKINLKIPIKIPRGKIIIEANRKSYLHVIIGLLLIIVNGLLLMAGTVGWIKVMEEKIMIALYTIPSIYVNGKFIMMMIKPQNVEEEKLE